MSAAAITEIRGALDSAKGPSLITIVRAVGQARDKASAKAIEGIAGAAEYLVAAEQQRRLTQPPPSDR